MPKEAIDEIESRAKDPNWQRLINLYSFVLNMRNDVDRNSPDYLIEKWNHWIGEDVKLEPAVIPAHFLVNFADYKKTWQLKEDENIKLIYYYLKELESGEELLDIRVIVNEFRHFNGNLLHICSKNKKGLHFILYAKMCNYFVKNENLFMAFIRDMRIDELELELE